MSCVAGGTDHNCMADVAVVISTADVAVVIRRGSVWGNISAEGMNFDLCRERK